MYHLNTFKYINFERQRKCTCEKYLFGKKMKECLGVCVRSLELIIEKKL